MEKVTMANKNKRVDSWVVSFSMESHCAPRCSLPGRMLNPLGCSTKDPRGATDESAPVVNCFPREFKTFYSIEEHADFVIWLCSEPALTALVLMCLLVCHFPQSGKPLRNRAETAQQNDGLHHRAERHGADVQCSREKTG